MRLGFMASSASENRGKEWRNVRALNHSATTTASPMQKPNVRNAESFMGPTSELNSRISTGQRIGKASCCSWFQTSPKVGDVASPNEAASSRHRGPADVAAIKWKE